MAGRLPLFASAPRAVISVSDGGVETQIAYAVGLSMNVRVNVEPVKILGQFAIQSLEPLQYVPVEGTFQIVRLLSKENQDASSASAKANASSLISAAQNATIGPAVPNQSSTSSSVLAQASLHRHLNPATILASQSFDVIIKLKVPVFDAAGVYQGVDANGNFDATKADTAEAFLKLVDCRVQNMSATISANKLFTEPLDFIGLLAVNQALGTNQEQADNGVTDGRTT